jgi:hypothetical protein
MATALSKPGNRPTTWRLPHRTKHPHISPSPSPATAGSPSLATPLDHPQSRPSHPRTNQPRPSNLPIARQKRQQISPPGNTAPASPMCTFEKTHPRLRSPNIARSARTIALLSTYPALRPLTSVVSRYKVHQVHKPARQSRRPPPLTHPPTQKASALVPCSPADTRQQSCNAERRHARRHRETQAP